MKNLTKNLILLLFAGATALSAFLAYCAFLKIEKNSSFILVLVFAVCISIIFFSCFIEELAKRK